MAKEKRSFSCTQCDYKSIKWIGCCPECSSWDSFQEVIKKPTVHGGAIVHEDKAASLQKLSAIPLDTKQRLLCGIQEWDRVVGGGIMPSSLIVLTGDPGIGKSTLLLQISNQLAQQYRVFYFSTEESMHQVKQRAIRLACMTDKLFLSDEAQLDTIIATVQRDTPDIIIIDSIQNCYLPHTQSIPGSIGQLRESTFQLMRIAKEYGVTVIITGHITKDGTMAGPKTLEHMVDAVFYLQGEDRWHTRVLRSVKNRFGTINELGFFEMHADGLQEVSNINKQLLSDIQHCPGSALISYIEGSRPLLLEVQALTVASKLAMPQRVVSGIDHKQVVLITAILEKYLRIKLSGQDIFCKISGGFKVKGSGIDLGIALALLSSYFQKPLPEGSLILGEISLTGSIKPINQINTHCREAEKFGITHLFVAQNQPLDETSCTVQRLANVYELLSLFTE